MPQTQNIISAVQQLRNQGLTDSLIVNELSQRGYDADEVQAALYQGTAAEAVPLPPGGQVPLSYEETGPGFAAPTYAESGAAYPPSPAADGNVYDRMEEIAESLIDQKWDELIAEVKKIVEWKERLESNQRQLQNDVDKLKEDFQLLHQGVLGKLEEYDSRMRDVGTELQAVGKVFKDVVPEFVDNVKELSAIVKEKKR